MYQEETGLRDNGATYSNFRLTASKVMEPWVPTKCGIWKNCESFI